MAIEIDGELIEIVDGHVHMGGRPRREKFDKEKNSVSGRAYYYSYAGEELVKAMDRSNVDAIIGFALGGFSSEYDYSDQNDLIAASMREYPGRIIGFCRLNPNVGEKTTCATIDRFVGELGMRGIKLHPEIDHFNLDERLLGPIFDKARDYGVPIIFHTGHTTNTDPLAIGCLASQYPKVPVILGHMGCTTATRQAATAAAQFENVYLETSTVCRMSHPFAPAVLKVGPDKVLYGSDHPYSPFQMEIEKLTKYAIPYTGWTAKDLKKILGGNLKRLVKAR
jgi:predicted TIM-barrel fold metal-dependent hydrolase